MPLCCLTSEVFPETGVARGGCYVHPCGLAAAKRLSRIRTPSPFSRPSVSRPGCRAGSSWDWPRGASRLHGWTSRYSRTAEFFQKADAVQIAGIANSSIGGKATEPHK